MIFIDLETTGLLAPDPVDLKAQPYITEIYCAKCKWESNELEFQDEFHSLVKPPIHISEEITRITNIDDNTVKNAPAFPRIKRKLDSFFLGEDTLVGHNLPFDSNVLFYELKRLNCHDKFPWPSNHICTVEATEHMAGKKLKLSALHEMAGHGEIKGHHRSKNDVMALIRVYIWLKSQGEL